MMSSLRSKRGYNLPDNTKVLVPIAGFPTTVNPILQNRFIPIFVDIEVDTLNLNLNQVELALAMHPDCKVITFAHVLGNPPNMNHLMDIVKRYDLILLEDCCDALGATYKGQMVGTFGDIATLSFYPAHHITMGEGGAVFTRNAELKMIAESFGITLFWRYTKTARPVFFRNRHQRHSFDLRIAILFPSAFSVDNSPADHNLIEQIPVTIEIMRTQTVSKQRPHEIQQIWIIAIRDKLFIVDR